jgi:hypothetical protein
MASSGMLRRVALVRTDVSEELNASIIRVILRSVRRLLVTTNVVPSSPILVTLMKEALCSSETSVLRRATRRNIPEHAIFQYQRSITIMTCIYLKLTICKPFNIMIQFFFNSRMKTTEQPNSGTANSVLIFTMDCAWHMKVMSCAYIESIIICLKKNPTHIIIIIIIIIIIMKLRTHKLA